LMAHSYAHLYGIPSTGLRFFTVYGPWGRPDMAIFKFTRLIDEGQPIPVYNRGHLVRDYTYIDDIIEGVVRVMMVQPPLVRGAHHAVYNIGNAHDVPLMTFIKAIESALGKTALIDFQDMQQGDVLATRADVSALHQRTGFMPATPITVGVQRFVNWYRDYARSVTRELV
jgi:UDP-glucuronate 4-epimerase